MRAVKKPVNSRKRKVWNNMEQRRYFVCFWTYSLYAENNIKKANIMAVLEYPEAQCFQFERARVCVLAGGARRVLFKMSWSLKWKCMTPQCPSGNQASSKCLNQWGMCLCEGNIELGANSLNMEGAPGLKEMMRSPRRCHAVLSTGTGCESKAERQREEKGLWDEPEKDLSSTIYLNSLSVHFLIVSIKIIIPTLPGSCKIRWTMWVQPDVCGE